MAQGETGGPAISTDEIVAQLNARAETLAPMLLPNGRRNGRFWETSSINDHHTGSYSLKVDMTGPKKGFWRDFATAKGSEGSGGNMLHLLAIRNHGGAHAEGYRDAIAWAKSWLGLDSMDPARVRQIRREIAVQERRNREEAEKRKQKMRDKARHLWFSAIPGEGTPAELYLRHRGIDRRGFAGGTWHWPGALRYQERCWCTEIRGDMPAMVASIVALSGEMMAVHRTYLDLSRIGEGIVTKAKLADAKLTMGEYRGGHIPLWKGDGRGKLATIADGSDVYISEGIEDGLSIALAHPDRRIVAGVALSNIGGLALPEQTGRMVLIGQNDSNEKTIMAVEAAIKRQQDAGHRVATIFPQPPYKDFNDQLNDKPMERVA